MKPINTTIGNIFEEVNQMIPYDAHVHSDFSFDADESATLDAICEAAIAKGITHLALTDHYDINAIVDGIYTYDAAAAKDAVEEAKEKYQNLLTLSYGIELGSATAYPERAEAFLKKQAFETVVGSVHYMTGCDDFYDWDMKAISDEDFVTAWQCYLAELTRLCELGVVDILAHLTYPLRYYMAAGRSFDLNCCKDELALLLTSVIDHGLLLEVNTSGYRAGMGAPMPDATILSLYKDLGGRLVSIGSDAHSPDCIAADYDRAEALLRSLGLNKIAFIQNKTILTHTI